MKERIFTKKSEQEKRRRLRNNMTKAETLLWLEIKNKKLGERFLRQYSIHKFVVDFYCPALKLVIEVDGVTHNTDDEINYDRQREEVISRLGISFLRFTNPEIYEDLHNVLEKIQSKIEEIKNAIKLN
jgi:leucyl-tRNA synthetase